MLTVTAQKRPDGTAARAKQPEFVLTALSAVMWANKAKYLPEFESKPVAYKSMRHYLVK
jgi:hypothetical protein